MKKKNLPVTNIGTISLMMVFIILCMVTFAALSLLSAVSDARAGKKMQAHTEEYYSASNDAEALLAKADRVFADAYKTAANTDEFCRIIADGTNDFATVDAAGEELLLTYQVDMNDSQSLFVQLAVHTPEQLKTEGMDSYYRILSWQVISTETWESDNTLKLLPF